MVPNFFRSAPGGGEAAALLWACAKAAYLDAPFPSLFKQRLMVYLFRFSPGQYWRYHHVGLLLGYGFASGDSGAAPQTAQDVVTLLQYPAPDAQPGVVAGLLRSQPLPMASMPQPGSRQELALFQLAAAIFLEPDAVEPARQSLLQALGLQQCDALLQMLAFARAAQFWALTHPRIEIEEEIATLIHLHPELLALLRAHSTPNPEYAAAAMPNADRRRESPSAAPAGDAAELPIALVAHELRNPLAAIGAVSEVFQLAGLPDPRLRKANAILQRQTEAMRQMLDDLAAINELTEEKSPAARASVPIDRILADAVNDHAQQLKEADVTVRLDLPASAVHVSGDRARLSQLFGKLLAEALHSVRGPGRLEVVMTASAERVTVSLGDAGAASHADPAGADPTDERRPMSTRLGFMLAKKLADLHGASLHASGAGAATRYVFSMPVIAQQERGRPRGVSGEAAKPALKVLVIEDNRDLAKLFCDLLDVMGCLPEVALNAKAGMDLARATTPDLVFCDLGLPGEKNGFDFARDLRAVPELAHIPLIAVTGHSSDEDRRQASAAGFDQVFAKPIKFSEIQELLNAFQARPRRPGI